MAPDVLAMVEGVTDPVLVLDDRGRVVHANAAASEALQYPRDELVGLRVDQLLPRYRRRWGVGLRRWLRRRVVRARGGAPEPSHCVRRDGTHLPVAIDASSVRTAHGRLAVLRLRELSAPDRAVFESMRRAQHELAETDAFLDSIIEHLPLMIFVKDTRELRFVRLNRAAEALIGLDRAALIGKTDHDLFPPEQARFFQARDRETIDSGRLVDIAEEPLATPRGERVLHTRKVVVRGRDGEPRYLVGISEDVTERRELERQLRESHRELERRVEARTDDFRRVSERCEDILRGVSHDLRSPLSVIQVQAQRLARREVDPERSRALGAIQTSVRRIESMLAELTSAARAEGFHLERAPIAIGPFVRDFLVRFAGVLDVGRVDVCIEDDPWALADPAAMDRVLSNLVSNALKYSPADARVNVSASRAGDEIVIAVRDAGAGIAPEDLSRIFERYWRASRTSGADGLGLGLYVTRQLLLAQGGRIRVESELGRGTTFYVSLPKA